MMRLCAITKASYGMKTEPLTKVTFLDSGIHHMLYKTVIQGSPVEIYVVLFLL